MSCMDFLRYLQLHNLEARMSVVCGCLQRTVESVEQSTVLLAPAPYSDRNVDAAAARVDSPPRVDVDELTMPDRWPVPQEVDDAGVCSEDAHVVASCPESDGKGPAKASAGKSVVDSEDASADMSTLDLDAGSAQLHDAMCTTAVTYFFYLERLRFFHEHTWAVFRQHLHGARHGRLPHPVGIVISGTHLTHDTRRGDAKVRCGGRC